MTKEKKIHGKLLVPESVKKQIDYLHSRYPGKEWSGIIAYRTLEADFDSLNNFKFEVITLYLMDLGESASTDFKYNEALANVYDICEKYGYGLEEVKTGLIHSHHNMSAYFSGTDMSELRNNATKTNYYLSLVVNTDEDYAAKVAFSSSVLIKEEHRISDDNGEFRSFVVEKESSSVIDLDLEVEIDDEHTLPDWFLKRYKEVEESKRQSKSKSKNWNTGKYGRTYRYGQEPHYGYGDGYDSFSYRDKYNKSTDKQAALPFPPTPKLDKEEEKLKETINDFGRELVSDLTGRYFGTLKSAVVEASKMGVTKKYTDEFDTIFSKLYIKSFGGKPSDKEEYVNILDELIDMIEDVTPIEGKQNNLLDHIKDELYYEYHTTEL